MSKVKMSKARKYLDSKVAKLHLAKSKNEYDQQLTIDSKKLDKLRKNLSRLDEELSYYMVFLHRVQTNTVLLFNFIASNFTKEQFAKLDNRKLLAAIEDGYITYSLSYIVGNSLSSKDKELFIYYTGVEEHVESFAVDIRHVALGEKRMYINSETADEFITALNNDPRITEDTNRLIYII